MDFFDKLGKTASKTYKITTQKTSKLAKEAKIKMQMNEHKAKIQSIYEEIGKKVYEHHVNDDDIDIDIESVVEENCIQIDELCDRIEEERKELLTLKDKKQCPNCFYEIDLDFHYCPNCGPEQEDRYCEDDNEKNNNEDTNNKENED